MHGRFRLFHHFELGSNEYWARWSHRTFSLLPRVCWGRQDPSCRLRRDTLSQAWRSHLSSLPLNSHHCRVSSFWECQWNPASLPWHLPCPPSSVSNIALEKIQSTTRGLKDPICPVARPFWRRWGRWSAGRTQRQVQSPSKEAATHHSHHPHTL